MLGCLDAIKADHGYLFGNLDAPLVEAAKRSDAYKVARGKNAIKRKPSIEHFGDSPIPLFLAGRCCDQLSRQRSQSCCPHRIQITGMAIAELALGTVSRPDKGNGSATVINHMLGRHGATVAIIAGDTQHFIARCAPTDDRFALLVQLAEIIPSALVLRAADDQQAVSLFAVLILAIKILCLVLEGDEQVIACVRRRGGNAAE